MSSSTPEWQGDVTAGVDAWVASAPDWVVDAVRESTGAAPGSSEEPDHQASGSRTLGSQTFGTRAPDGAGSGAEDPSSRSDRRSARGTRNARGARKTRGSGGTWGEGGGSGRGSTGPAPGSSEEPDHQASGRRTFGSQTFGTRGPDGAGSGAEDPSSRSDRRSARGTRNARGARKTRGSGGTWGEGGGSSNRRRGGGRTQEPPEGRDLGPEPDHEAVARKILLDQLTGQARSRAELATKRSEEHTSELQSLMRISYAVFCLKQKNTKLH